MKLTGKLSGLVLGAMTMVMASLIGCSNGSDSTLPVPTGSGDPAPTETIMGEGELTWSGLEITNYTKYAKAGAKIHLDVTKRKDGDAEYCKVLILDKDWGDSGVTEACFEGSTENKIDFETKDDKGQPCYRPCMEGEGQYYFVLNEAACAKPTLSLFGNATVKKITIEYVGGKKEGNKQPEGGEFDRGLASELSNDMSIFNETGAGTIEAESVRKAKINITNVGTDAWHVQFSNDITGAAAGDVYTISFKMKSEKARKVAWQVSGGTEQYGYIDGDTLTFTEGEDKTVSKDVTINSVTFPPKFQINMGKQADEETPAGYIILEDVSIIKKSSGSGSGEPLFSLDYTGAALPPNDYDSSSADSDITFTPNECLSITKPWKEYSISAKNIPDLSEATKIIVEYKYSSDATFGDTDNDKLMIGIINQGGAPDYAVTNLSWTCVYKKSAAGATLPTEYTTDTKAISWEQKYDEHGSALPLVTDFATIKGIRVYTTNMTAGTVYIKSIKFIK